MALYTALTKVTFAQNAERGQNDFEDQWQTAGPALRAPANSGVAEITAGTSTGVALWSKIAYQSDRDGNWEIYITRGDGSQPFRLTDNPANDIRPQLNRGATRIVFASDRIKKGMYAIYAVNVDGSDLIRLTDNDAINTMPAWSPDGSRIAFVSERDGNAEIYMMNADGSNQTRLTNDSEDDFGPTWSPDGAHIAWVRMPSSGDSALMIANADGSQAYTLRSLHALQHLAYAPDGQSIAFDYDAKHDGWNALGIISLAYGSLIYTYAPGPGTQIWMGSWSPQANWLEAPALLINRFVYDLDFAQKS